MTFTIAVAGKGGVGKTTLSAALVLALSGRRVLAVDADANSNLGEKLGVGVEGTIGEIRDSLRDADAIPPGISRQEHMARAVQGVIAEAEAFDLVTMGRPEGEGCYCFVNNVLREFFSRALEGYDVVVIDNEAGMEHLSRRILGRIDLLLMVSDPTRTGVRTARRISELADEVGVEVGRRVLAVSRAPARLHPAVEAEAQGFDEVVLVPVDEQVEELNIVGSPLASLDPSGPLMRSAARLLRRAGVP